MTPFQPVHPAIRTPCSVKAMRRSQKSARGFGESNQNRFMDNAHPAPSSIPVPMRQPSRRLEARMKQLTLKPSH